MINERKIMKFAFLIVACIMFIGSFIFLAYYSNKDLYYIKEYKEIGTYQFYPSEVIKTREKYIGKTPDTIRYYIEYTTPDEEYIWRKRILFKKNISNEKPTLRKVIKFSNDYITIPSEKVTEKYIKNRKTLNKIIFYTSLIMILIMPIILFLIIKKFIKFIKDNSVSE